MIVATSEIVGTRHNRVTCRATAVDSGGRQGPNDAVGPELQRLRSMVPAFGEAVSDEHEKIVRFKGLAALHEGRVDEHAQEWPRRDEVTVRVLPDDHRQVVAC